MVPSVSVTGTVFIDCKGFANQNYQPDTRNLGSIQFVHGGVGRNVAENLANLGVTTTFVSSVDSTAMGKEVIERLKKVGVDTRHLAVSQGKGMGMWLAILDENGNLAGSISQMPELDCLQDIVGIRGDEFVSSSSHIVLELDLNERIARNTIYHAKKHKKPIYGIPGNLDIILHHPDLLGDLDCFICNNFEADLFLEMDFTNASGDEQQEKLARFVEQAGVGAMVVTLGENGSVYYDANTRQAGYQPVFPVNLVDSSGAGDAFFSGTVMGLARGLALRDAVVCGTKVAGWTIESAENICVKLSEKVTEDAFFQNLLVK